MSVSVIELLSIVLGVIGTFTGCLALVFQYLAERKNNVNLVIKVDKTAYYVDKTPLPKFESECYAFINLKISNCSSLPITIDSVGILGTQTMHMNFDKECPRMNMTDKKYMSFENHLVLELPLRIDCYDSKYVCVKFPFFDKYKGKDITLEFVTPRKAYRLLVCPTELTALFYRSFPGEQLLSLSE